MTAPEYLAKGGVARMNAVVKVESAVRAMAQQKRATTMSAEMSTTAGEGVTCRHCGIVYLGARCANEQCPVWGRATSEAIPYSGQSAEWRAGYDEAEQAYHAKQADLRRQLREARSDYDQAAKDFTNEGLRQAEEAVWAVTEGWSEGNVDWPLVRFIARRIAALRTDIETTQKRSDGR